MERIVRIGVIIAGVWYCVVMVIGVCHAAGVISDDTDASPPSVPLVNGCDGYMFLPRLPVRVQMEWTNYRYTAEGGLIGVDVVKPVYFLHDVFLVDHAQIKINVKEELERMSNEIDRLEVGIELMGQKHAETGMILKSMQAELDKLKEASNADGVISDDTDESPTPDPVPPITLVFGRYRGGELSVQARSVLGGSGIAMMLYEIRTNDALPAVLISGMVYNVDQELYMFGMKDYVASSDTPLFILEIEKDGITHRLWFDKEGHVEGT